MNKLARIGTLVAIPGLILVGVSTAQSSLDPAILLFPGLGLLVAAIACLVAAQKSSADVTNVPGLGGADINIGTDK